MSTVKGFNVKNMLPVIVSVFFMCLLLGIIEYDAYKENGNKHIYPLDDTYIHLQIAKNITISGTWGINSNEFSSASSSILYPWIIAFFFKAMTVSTIIPLLVNIIAAIFLLIVIDKWCRKQGVASLGRLLILIGVVLLTPLPVIVRSGMEHTLHCLFNFLFLATFVNYITECKIPQAEYKNRNRMLRMLIYAALLTSIRYEGVFIVFIACIILLTNLRFKTSILLGFIALLPILVFGIISIQNHNYFLPNSVLLKSEKIPFEISNLPQYVLNITKTLSSRLTNAHNVAMLATQRILFIIPLVILSLKAELKEKQDFLYFLFILLTGTLFHLTFANVQWNYRYEAYLISSTSAIVLLVYIYFGIKKLFQGRINLFFSIIIAFLVSFPLFQRSISSIRFSSLASINIYQQQYQMASFLANYYNNDVIAANDIGAISFFTKIKTIDLWGLGNIDIAKSKRGKNFDSLFVNSLLLKENVKIAVIYNSWFSKEIYSNWKKAATWKISNNVVCGEDNITFYAIRDEDFDKLKENLELFRKNFLPNEVKVEYY